MISLILYFSKKKNKKKKIDSFSLSSSAVFGFAATETDAVILPQKSNYDERWKLEAHHRTNGE